MRRLMTFLLGMIAGAGLLYAALHFHVIKADDGLHFVAKTKPRLTSTYVDIRGFTISDWTENPALLQALLQSNKPDLVDSATTDALRGGLENILQRSGSR